MTAGAAPAAAFEPDLTKASIPALMSEARAAAESAERRFSLLSASQLNWKPRPDAWSVAQCLDHLIVTNMAYHGPVIAKIEQGRYEPPVWTRIPLAPRVFGRLLIRALQPDSKRLMKAPAPFQPSVSDLDSLIVRRFIDHQFELIRWMESCRDKQQEKTIISSPTMPAITYSLLDAFRIIVVHQQRHLAQARRVTESPGFPAPAVSAR